MGKNDTGRDNDLWFLKELLNAARDEQIEVLTSTLSIAECAHAKGDVNDDVKSLFKRFLTSGRYVFLVQDSVLVAEKARDLRWAHGLCFGGADAIHLASAMELKCDEFLTWDQKIHAQATALNDLALSVRFPHDTHCLPDEYRQQQLIAETSTEVPKALPPAPESTVPIADPPVAKAENSKDGDK